MTNPQTTDPATEFERRVMAGEDVTEAEAVAAHAESAGRRWFADLRARAAERKAAQDAERAENERGQAAIAAAREALAPYSPAAFTAAFDDAARALGELARLAHGRNATILRLAQAGEVPGSGMGQMGGLLLPLPEGQPRWVDLTELVTQAATQGRMGVGGDVRCAYVVDDAAHAAYGSREPEIVAEGRADG